MEGRDLADLYFRRWPVQENFFKDAGVLGLSQHRGNCGTIVSNVAVVSELERMESRASRDAETLAQLSADADQMRAHGRGVRTRTPTRSMALATRRGRLDDLIAQSKTSGKMFAASALDHQRALVQAESCAKASAKARARLKRTTRAVQSLRPDVTNSQLGVHGSSHSALFASSMSHRTRSSLPPKLTAMQLICFVLREYVSSLAMTPETFIQRVFTIHGRKELRMNEELIVFYENPRDPAINDALRDACRHLNKRALQRDNRTLRFAVETGLAVDVPVHLI